MSRLFLFAIGGTGARVVRSLTMMLASGIDGLDSSTEIVPIIIDYDLANGDKTRAIRALEKYAAIHDELYPNANQNYADHFFMTKLTPLSQAGIANTTGLKDFEFNFGPGGTSMKFSEYLGLMSMDTVPKERLTKDLLNALYDDSTADSKDAELELDMNKGFKGNPNIGSVVFHDLRDTTEFHQFEGVFNAATDSVFIVSSVFGGTGASGFPEIVNAIRSSPLATLQPATIGAALVLPYFDLQQYNPANGDTGAIDAASFNAKTRAALSFYATNNGINSKVNALYYIGDENHDSYEYNEGEDRQKNAAHVVEFVAASSIVDFMQDNRQQQIANGHMAFEFSIKDERIGTSIQLPDFEHSTHTIVLDNLSSFAIAMKYYRDVICGDRQEVSNSTAFYNRFNLGSKLGRGLYYQLDEFLDAGVSPKNDWGFYSWLDELQAHAHKLYLYCMDKSKEMKEVLTYKTISERRLGKKPIADATISEKLSSKTKGVKDGSEQLLLKDLRDIMKDTYNNVK